MCYLPDWARAAVALAERRNEFAQFEDIPFPGHTLSAQDIRSGLERITGHSLRFRRFPWWALTLASPFWELARELKELRYLWETDHALSDQRLKALLPDFKAASLDEVLRSALPLQAVARPGGLDDMADPGKAA